MNFRFIRVLFYLAGGFNLLVALALLTAAPGLWQWAQLAPPADPIFLHLFLMFVALFGLAYFWIGHDLRGKRPLIQFAIVGKCAAFLTVLAHWALGAVPFKLVLLASGDLLFAGLFFAAL